MVREIRGDLHGLGLRIGIVVARFNEVVTHQLLKGAQEGLAGHGVAEEDVVVLWVPGSLELPVTAMTLAQAGRYNAIICLGAVIRGETSHYDLVSGQAAAGIMTVSVQTGVPVIFGVLATDDLGQALNRAGGKVGNKGYDAALAAIEMARLLQATRDKEPRQVAAGPLPVNEMAHAVSGSAAEPVMTGQSVPKLRWQFWKKD